MIYVLLFLNVSSLWPCRFISFLFVDIWLLIRSCLLFIVYVYYLLFLQYSIVMCFVLSLYFTFAFSLCFGCMLFNLPFGFCIVYFIVAGLLSKVVSFDC